MFHNFDWQLAAQIIGAAFFVGAMFAVVSILLMYCAFFRTNTRQKFAPYLRAYDLIPVFTFLFGFGFGIIVIFRERFPMSDDWAGGLKPVVFFVIAIAITFLGMFIRDYSSDMRRLANDAKRAAERREEPT
jgi:glucan phosphoethanolaminetransferase (alkaline phosphatase superfamily)